MRSAAALSLILIGAAPAAETAVDAERAFARQAQTHGQWTAFRAFAAPDAVLFGPGPANAHLLLKDSPDPPVAVMWWPGRTWVSCDGGLAINSGPWVRRGGTRTGTFTTVWKRQKGGGWKWLLDHGRDTPKAVAAGETVRVSRPACRNLSRASSAPLTQESAPDLLVQLDDRMPSGKWPNLNAEEGDVIAAGASQDGSLRWEARSLKGAEGAHMLRAWLWDGSRHRLALYEASGVEAQ